MEYYVYILTNKSNTLYVGVTGNLNQRVEQHISKSVKGFTAKYNINKPIFYQEFNSINEAIAAEKRINQNHQSRVQRSFTVFRMTRYAHQLNYPYFYETM